MKKYKINLASIMSTNYFQNYLTLATMFAKCQLNIMSKVIPVIISLLCFSTYSQTTITGNISGMTFKPSGNPWIVMDNVFVETGSKTVIKPGCIFLFKSFTGIIVQGSIEVDGLPEMPIVFTSINDSLYNEASIQNPEPFD